MRQDHSRLEVQQSELEEHQIHRQSIGHRRPEPGCQNVEEDVVARRHLEPGKSIGRQRSNRDRQSRTAESDDQRVEEVGVEPLLAQDLSVVFKRHFEQPPRRRRQEVGTMLEARKDDPDIRDQDHDKQDCQRDRPDIWILAALHCSCTLLVTLKNNAATTSEKNASTRQMAAPYPRSHLMNVVLKANTAIVSVAFPGPPPVRM